MQSAEEFLKKTHENVGFDVNVMTSYRDIPGGVAVMYHMLFA